MRCRERERQIPASIARSLLCQDMLMNIVYVVNSEGHFGSMREREREREREYLVKLLGLFVGRWMKAYE